VPAPQASFRSECAHRSPRSLTPKLPSRQARPSNKILSQFSSHRQTAGNTELLGNLLGSLLAIFFLVGRWSIGRLTGETDADSILAQPRLWIVVAIVPVVLLLRQRPIVRPPSGRTKAVDVAICLFLAYMLLAALWAGNTTLALEKAWEVALMLVVALLLCASRAAVANRKILDGFWWTIVLFGIVMAGLAILLSSGGRIHVPGGGPNAFGRNMGLMALGAVYLGGKTGMKTKPLCAAAIVVAALCILLCGSRGALLSSTVGAAILVASARQALPKKVAAAGVVSLLGMIVIFNTSAGQEALDTFQTRIVHQTFERRHLSDRDDLWWNATDSIREHPWVGLGLNGFHACNSIYPHNIFLEVTAEGGVIGLFLLLNVGRTWWSAAKRDRLRMSWATVSAFGLILCAAQTSGDLFDSRGVFILVALAVPLTEPSLRIVARVARTTNRYSYHPMPGRQPVVSIRRELSV
jgi:O-antigen ligase